MTALLWLALTAHATALAPRVADLPAPLRAELAALRADLDGARDAAALGAAWRRADALAARLEPALTQDLPCHDLDLRALNAELPHLQVTCVAEGAWPLVELPPGEWRALALATPEPADDAFVAMMGEAWGSARRGAYPAWVDLTWDYGGCTRVGAGEGSVHRVLLATDRARAAGDLVPEETARLRQELLETLTMRDAANLCEADTLGPTPDRQLAAEVTRLLAEVALAPGERAAVEQALPLRGEPFTGG